MQPAPVLDFQS